MMTTINKADLTAGLLFMFFGAAFGLQCPGLEMGTTQRIGPGCFPVVLAVVLPGLGIAIVVSLFGSLGEDIGNHAWRGMVFNLAGPLFFGLNIRGLGFVPTNFVTTLIAALAGLKRKPLYAVGLTIFCTLVLSVALGLPFRRFGPWLPVRGRIMDLLSNLGLGFATAASPENLLFCLIGMILGTLIGVLPGIGATATIAMLLPITFQLEPVSSLIIAAFCSIVMYYFNSIAYVLYAITGFGLLGYALLKLRCKPAPLLFGFVLGPLLEESLRRAMILGGGDPTTFLTRPISASLLVLTVVVLVVVLMPGGAKETGGDLCRG